MLTLGGRTFTSENLGIGEQYFFVDQASEAIMMINQYLAPCANHNDIVKEPYAGFYWDSLEINSGSAIHVAFGWNNNSNNNLHFVATIYGGKSTTMKVRAFVAF